MKIEAQEYARNYHRFTVTVDFPFERWLFACSDIHIDNPKCNRELLKEHFDLCLERDAMICIFGDLFCLMQGKYDKRRNKSAIMPAHMGEDYIDLVINEAAEFLKPYAKNILLITTGNHESKVSNNLETNILARFIERLNLIAESQIKHGAYDGYFTLQFKGQGSTTTARALQCGYSHGRWGGIVTKGVMAAQRHSSYMPDCDIHFSGHTHDTWAVKHPILRKNTHQRKVEVIQQYHVKTGTYKEEYEKGEGWAVEKIGMPKSSDGGMFVKITGNTRGLKFKCVL
jgi:hypothetical protein